MPLKAPQKPSGWHVSDLLAPLEKAAQPSLEAWALGSPRGEAVLHIP